MPSTRIPKPPGRRMEDDAAEVLVTTTMRYALAHVMVCAVCTYGTVIGRYGANFALPVPRPYIFVLVTPQTVTHTTFCNTHLRIVHPVQDEWPLPLPLLQLQTLQMQLYRQSKRSGSMATACLVTFFI